MKLVNKSIQALFVSAALLLNFSCSKQEAPSIQTTEIRSQEEIERLQACSFVNFNKGVLLHLNMIYLFKCTKWDQEFPHMYQSIKRIRTTSWDHLMGPIDKEFVENLARRDRVFNNIKDLDAKNGLDDLSRVIVALNETNFFDSVRDMFKCVENSSEEICAERMNIPSKASLTNIIKLVDTRPDTIDRASMFVKALNKSIGVNEEKLRVEVNKFIKDPVFINVKLKVVDALAKKMQDGLSKEDREFPSSLLLAGSTNKNEPWIYTWIHNIKMSRDKFRDLIEYPVLTNPAFIGEVKGLKQAYDGNFNCSIKSTLDPNELIAFDFKTQLYDYVTVIKKRDYKAYYDYSSSQIVGLKMSTEVCKELENNKYNVNFVKMLTNFASFLGEKRFYDLVKFLASHTAVSGDQDKTFAENLYLFDLIASDVFSSANAINEQIVKHTREFYPTIFDVIESLPPEAFLDLGEMVQDFLKEENDLKFKGVADFWSFFNSTEKNFLFNFVDRHFEGDTQYVLLFDFYTKFLDDLREVQPVFKEKWIGTDKAEEMSYLTLEDFFYQLAGRDTLQDFKRFFGRDQILKVLEVISNGSNINAKAREELAYRRSDEYVTRSRGERYRFKVVYNPTSDADYDSRPVVECMKKFSEIENGFYYLVRKLPEACSKVSEANIAFRVFGWLNSIEDSYRDFNPPANESDSLLSQKGLLSPYMLNNTLGITKILDSLLGDIDSQLPTKKGISYLMTSAKFHLNDQNAAALVDKNLAWLNRWFTVLPEENLIHRNALLKTFTRDQNFARVNEVSKDLAALATEYSEWVKDGNLARIEQRSFGEFDPNQSCEKVVNQVVSRYACPSKDIVKKHTNSIAKYLTTTWEKDQGTAIAALLKSVKPGEGLNIPLNGKTTKKYRLTLKETVKYLYDSSDKTFDINRTKTKYVNEAGKKSTETLTTLERIEVVIRDVRFDNNYLGVAFLNAITHAQDYNDEADKRKGLLSKCLKIPVIRCSKSMNDNELRMARNALETFDSLIDINNGRGLDARLKYGNFLKTFEQTLVASSAIDAQKVQLLPLDDDHLVRHNGRILGDMTAMTMWSNTARVIRDRVGRTREEFERFINSQDFNRVDKALLYGFDLPQAGPSAERLLKKLQAVPNGETQNAIDHTIDWISSLDYNQTRLVENTIARLLVVSSYLGSPDFVFGVAPKSGEFDRYKENNLFQMFMALEKVVEYWPVFKNFYPTEMNLIDAFKPLHTALVFVTEKLAATNDPEKNIAYQALNELFIGLQATMFDELADPRINVASGKTVKGLDLLMAFIQNPKNINQTYRLIYDDYKYLDTLHANQASWFKAFGQNVARVANSAKVDLTFIRDYLNFTTKSAVCFNESSDCVSNYHFDEAANLSRYLNRPAKNGESNFMLATKKVLVENFDQLNGMIDDLVPSLKIKETKPPLRFN